MEGQVLLTALRRTKHQIKLIDPDRLTVLRMISAEQALDLLANAAYVGGGNKHRVRTLRRSLSVPRRSDPVRDESAYRVSGSPLLPPSAEWLRRMGYSRRSFAHSDLDGQ